MQTQQTGTVKFFNYRKGFGFITPANGGNDVFVHIADVERAGISDLNEGDKLQFELGQSRKPGQTKAVKLRAL